jgi:tetratricopeptide (TPR) repeat protein
MAGDKSEQMAQQAQNFYAKGQAAYERRNYDIAIDLLMQCLTRAPSFSRARKVLRSAQIAKFKMSKISGLASKIRDIKAAGTRTKIKGMLSANKTAMALIECEKLLTMNPLHALNVEIAVQAAEASGHPDAALFTVEAAYENNQDDMNLLRRVADFYMAVGEYTKARDAYLKLNAFVPTDQSILKKLKDAEARVTMASGWEENSGEKGGFRNLIADKEQAEKLDKQNKAVLGGSDADDLIADALKHLEQEPENMNYYRALARLYTQNKMFDKAVDILEAAIKKNASDPELDRSLSNAKIESFKSRIADANALGDESAANQVENEMNQFIFDDLSARVQSYPNDLKLRFELGMQYFQYEYFDDAIGQFQLSQRSPKERVLSLYYLAICFDKKGQCDMAVMQLETANEQLPLMDDLKKKVVFRLGVLAEEAGDIEKAFAYYKDVYGADIGFEDIGARMENIYKLRKAKEG